MFSRGAQLFCGIWEPKAPQRLVLGPPAAAQYFGSEQEELASFLKDREAEGVKSAHFYFPNDLDASTQTTNHIIIEI